MFDGNYSEPEDRMGAIPEAKAAKAEIMGKQREAEEALDKLEIFNTADAFKQFRSKVFILFLKVMPQIQNLNRPEQYESLEKIRDRDFKRADRERGIKLSDLVSEKDKEFWKKRFDELNQAIYDLGITNIALVKNDEPFGYEFLKGLDHNLQKDEDPGWKKLKENLKNMRRLLRKDTDMVGLVYGGNRTGKTTLSIQIARIIQYGENEGDMDPSHFIFNDNDFQEAMDNSEKYDARHIDEMSLLFHKRDGMNTEQKDRNKMMKTYAKKNQFFIGCDNNFYNIDGEFRSDKVDFVIHVPKRGKFEFYSKAKVHKFTKGEDGTPETPQPDIEGRFPNLNPENGQTDPVWKTYKEVEDKKLEVVDDDDESNTDIMNIANQVIDNIDNFLKELEGRDPIVSHRLIKAQFGQQEDLSTEDAKAVKDVVENRVDLSEWA